MAPALPDRAYADDTIFALSSGRPPAAIAIVRISGPAAGDTLTALAGRRPAARVARLARLRDAGGGVLDEALILWFPGPRSATGEDLAELHLHGGIAVVEAVLATLARRAGLRMAEPGEFTRRAVLNGRLDLHQAEGLADLLAAETEAQRREALRRTEGLLGRRLRGWADRIVAVSAMIEAAIDYDGELDAEAEAGTLDALDGLIAEIGAALALPSAERLRDGVRIAVIGPPNAGKSSLFNCLVGRSAAIVSPEPGTTRDLIERPIVIAGLPIVLIDTAGVRDSDDAIEREGVARARQVAEAADLTLDLSDGATSTARRIAVSAKSDLHRPVPDTLPVSSLTGEGLPELIDAIAAAAAALVPADGEVAFDRRYRTVLQQVIAHLASAQAARDSVVAAEELRLARTQMDNLIGGANLDSVLDALFSRFCLGK